MTTAKRLHEDSTLTGIGLVPTYSLNILSAKVFRCLPLAESHRSRQHSLRIKTRAPLGQPALLFIAWHNKFPGLYLFSTRYEDLP